MPQELIYDNRQSTYLKFPCIEDQGIEIEYQESKQYSTEASFLEDDNILENKKEASLEFKYSNNDPLEINYKKPNPKYVDIDKKIAEINLPKKWELENISFPTLKCKIKAKKISHFLYKKYKIFPSRIAASIEEGILIYYLTKKNNRSLSVEIYNDLEIAAIVNDEKNNKIIYNELIEKNNFETIMNHFYEQ